MLSTMLLLACLAGTVPSPSVPHREVFVLPERPKVRHKRVMNRKDRRALKALKRKGF